MSIALLDVNFLIALFDPMHIHHENAHRWFGLNKRGGWASCPMTINGCIRVLSNPAYPTVTANPAEVAERLHAFTSASQHHFWPDSVLLTDSELFRWPMITSHQKITDVYLLGLAVNNHGRLATFDKSIPLNAVRGALAGHLVLL
jgi:toxin-antitoxin system PIN domain toxin